MKGFIETSDNRDNGYLINVNEIAALTSLDKYTREITLRVVDEKGRPMKILSAHSYEELVEMIKFAQES